MKALFALVFLLSMAASASNAETIKWTQTNGPFGGSVKMLAQNSQGDIFALTEYRQLFKRTADKDKWEYLRSNVYYFTIAPNDDLLLGEIKSDTTGSITGSNISLFDPELNLIKIVYKTDESFLSDRKFLITNSGGIYILFPSHGLYFSNDQGNNWLSLDSQFPYKLASDSAGLAFCIDWGKRYLIRYNSSSNVADSVKINTIDSSIYGTDIEYNGKFNRWILVGSDSCIYYTSDTGASWIKSVIERPVQSHNLIVSKSGDMFIYSEDNSYSSTDGGDSWRRINGFDSLNATWFIEHAGKFVFSKQTGIFQFDSSSRKINDFNKGLIASLIREIVVDKDGVVFASAGSELFRSKDGGVNWTNISPGELWNNGYYNVFCSSLGYLFIDSFSDSWMSTDKGDTWNTLKVQKDSVYFPLKVIGEDDRFKLYAGTLRGSGVDFYASDDDAKTWNRLKIGPLFGFYYPTLATHRNQVFIGGYMPGSYYSDNRGKYFDSVDIPVEYISQYEAPRCIFNSVGDLFVILNKEASAEAVAFRTNNGGITFSELPQIKYASSFIHVDSLDNIYTQGPKLDCFGGRILIRFSDNGDSSEIASDRNDPRLSVTDICFGPNNTAYIGTAYNGVFRTDKVNGARESRSAANSKLQISPNPVTERAMITFGENLGPLEITIYNQIGEIMYTGRQSEGRREIEIPVEEFPQGAYFVKVSAGGEVATGRFTIVR